MPSLLTPYPPTTLSLAARPQARSGSTSFGSTANAFSSYFSRFTRGSSRSAHLTDVTLPITPSHTKEHSPCTVDDSTGALAQPESRRSSRSRQFVDIGDEDGYATDCERSSVFDAVDVLRSWHLEKCAPNVHVSTQRAFKAMGKHIKTAIEFGSNASNSWMSRSQHLLCRLRKASGRRGLSRTGPVTM